MIGVALGYLIIDLLHARYLGAALLLVFVWGLSIVPVATFALDERHERRREFQNYE